MTIWNQQLLRPGYLSRLLGSQSTGLLTQAPEDLRLAPTFETGGLERSVRAYELGNHSSSRKYWRFVLLLSALCSYLFCCYQFGVHAARSRRLTYSRR